MRTIGHRNYKLSESYLKHLFIYILVLSGGILIWQSCDSTTSPENPLTDQPSLTNLTINPSLVQFEKEKDGFRDTTLTVVISAVIQSTQDMNPPRFSVLNKNSGELIIEGELSQAESNDETYIASAEINTTTTSNENFIINVILDTPQNSYAQTTFSVRGFPNIEPEIIYAKNSAEVQIPNDDEVIPVRFEAKVTDEDGQDNISGVYIEFLNEDGTKLIPNPNQLLDDGQNSNPSDSGDEIAGDSVYTIRFFVDSTNTPNMRTAQYYALDETGLSSDTVETTFNIIE